MTGINRWRTETGKFSRTTVLILVLVATALGAGLRTYSLAEDNLWRDEMASTVLSGATNVEAVVDTTAHRDAHPPGYYLLLHAWRRVFGSSDAAIRSLSVVLGIAAIPAMFFLGRELFGTSVGLTAAFILSAMPTSIRFSQEARNYALLTLAIIIAWYFAIRLTSARDRWALAGFTIVAVLLPWIHYWGGVALGGICIIAFGLAIRSQERRSRLWGFVPGVLASALAFLPWVRVILNNQLVTARSGSFPEGVSFASFLGVFGRPFGNRLLITPVGVLALVTVFAAVIVLVWLSSERHLSGHGPHAIVWVLGMMILPVVIIAGIAEFTTFWMGIRIPNVTTVPVTVICAAAIVGLWRWKPLVGATLASVVAFLCVAGVWRCYVEVQRPHWEQVAAVIQAQERPGDVIVTIDDQWVSDAVRRYYRGSLRVDGLSREIQRRRNIIDAAMKLWPEGGRMWLIPRNPADSKAPEILQEIASRVEQHTAGHIRLLQLHYPDDPPDVESDEDGGTS